jgi:hypothetical protein
MTNEQLASAIQKGRDDLIPQLWDQVVDFIKYMASKRLKSAPEEKQDLFDDMVNEAYFHFLEAIKGFRAAEGSLFVTYLKFHLKTAFTTVLYGGHSIRKLNEPLNTATSIDKPLATTSGSETFTLASTLVDENAEAPYRSIEEASYWNAVHYKLRSEIESVKAPPTAKKILLHQLEHGSTATQAREVLGLKADYQGYNEAVRRLKTRLKDRSRTDEDLAEAIPVRGYSVKRFKERGYTSLVEEIALKNAEIDLEEKRYLSKISRDIV